MKKQSTHKPRASFYARRRDITDEPLFGVFGALCLHIFLPPLSRVDSLRPHHLRRGVVEGALFGFSGAGFHALSVA